MPGYWDEFDDAADGASGADDASDDASDDARDKKALLKQLIEAGGEFGRLASEALAAMEDREAAEARQAAQLVAANESDPQGIAELMAVYEALRMDPSADPAEVRAAEGRVEALKDALRAQVLVDRAVTDARVLSEFEAALRAEAGIAAGEALPLDFASRVEDLRQQIAQAAEWSQGSDPLEEHQMWRAYQWERVQQERAEALAYDMAAERPDAWDRAVAEASEANDAHVDGLLAGVE